jgi:adenylosuccinate synthase
LHALKKIAKNILPFIADASLYLSKVMAARKSILLEGANGTLLDLDHGTFPYVTSSNASLGGILAGSAVAPSRLTKSIGIMKAYVTRVGSGPFPTEFKDALGDKIREIGHEFGATTGRPRRCGWFDAVAAQYSMRLNGFSAINLTKVDVLSTLPKLKIGTAYIYKGKKLVGFPADLSALEQCRVENNEMPGWQEDISGVKDFRQLPKNCRAYIEKLEELIGCPIQYIGTGRRREEMIFR